ncbi:MAG: dihydroneopterin triphosphate diphosphatase [Herbaspirillum sp.]
MKTTYKIPESVLVVIYSADLDVLLMERSSPRGFWQSVTGSKNTLDETLEHTAIREVAEETGIQIAGTDVPAPNVLKSKASASKVPEVKIPLGNLKNWQLSNEYELYPVWRDRYAPGVMRNTEHVFGLLVPSRIAVALAAREHVNFRWLPYQEAADQCFSPSNAEAILQLPQRTVQSARSPRSTT